MELESGIGKEGLDSEWKYDVRKKKSYLMRRRRETLRVPKGSGKEKIRGKSMEAKKYQLYQQSRQQNQEISSDEGLENQGIQKLN